MVADKDVEARSAAPGVEAADRAGDGETTVAPAGRSTLRRRLFLLFIAFSLGPLLVTNVWGYLVSRSYRMGIAVGDVGRVARTEAAKTLITVREQRDFISALVDGDPFLLSFSATMSLLPPGPERRSVRHSLSRFLASRAEESPAAREFLVLAPDGALLSSSDPDLEAPGNMSRSPCFVPGADGVRIVGFEHGDAEPTLLVAAPIRTAGNTLLGVFCARYRFVAHHALVAARRQLSDRSAIHLLDENGRVVCGSDEHRLDDRGHPAHDPPAEVLAKHQPWTGRYRPGGSDEVIAAFEPIGELGWSVLVELPVTAALADLERLKWQALVIGGLLAALLTLAIFLTSRSLARQLGTVAAAAKRIAAGALGERIPTHGPEEIAQLATAFNQMSLSVRDSQRLLEQRIAERTHKLRESQEFTELLLDSVEQRVIVVDQDGRIIKTNRTADDLYGPDLAGRLYDDVFSGLVATGGPHPIRDTLATGRPASAERTERTPEGQEIVSIVTYPVATVGGVVESVVEIGRVVTIEKQVQAQMIHHEKMAAFGMLAAGVAHEIGNPLASIQSQLRMVRDAPEPGRVERTLEVVDREVARIGRLLRELVDLARRKRHEITLVSLNQVVEDVVRLVGHDPRARNVRMESRLAQGLPGVRAREDHLVQVLLNLGINALDAMPDGGALTFETSPSDGAIAVRVIDTGHGLTSDARRRLFEPFFTTKGPERGTGLGLFVSRAIAGGLGGRLELERTGPEGTVFVLEITTEGRPGHPVGQKT